MTTTLGQRHRMPTFEPNTGRGYEFTMVFGDEWIRFEQQGDGTHVDHGDAWPTGLYLAPEGLDLTEVDEDEPAPSVAYASPACRELREHLAELGRHWAVENDVFAAEGAHKQFAAFPHFHRREGQLRDLYEQYASRGTGRIMPGTGVIGI